MEIDQKKIFLAAELLRKGEVVAFPTETVYGLGARLSDARAIQKIYALKGRPADNPMIVHVAKKEEILSLAEDIPRDFFLLMEQFFPGPLTVVLKKKRGVSEQVSSGLPTIALRMPSHPIARALIESLGEPVPATSANLSGRPSPTIREHVLEDFGDKLPLVLDGGPCMVGIESTVISLVHKAPTLLRPGSISLDELEKVLGKKVEIAGKQEAPMSPGMKYRHYAPKAKVILFDEKEELMAHVQKKLLKRMILSTSLSVPGLLSRALSFHSLYHALREADQKEVEEILVLCDPMVKRNLALMNRLTLASL